jgi:dolichol-phosphate mannosyltransferase
MYDVSSVMSVVPEITIVIPARNEQDNISETIADVHHQLDRAHIMHEVIVVDDHSTDHTGIFARRAKADVYRNTGSAGYGHAVRLGLEHAQGQYVTVMVADGSDRAADLVRMCGQRWKDGIGRDMAVFGHRFIKGAIVTDYPRIKRVANRLGNHLTARMMGVKYTDISNPFKLYPTHVVKQLLPLMKAGDFSFGFELCCRYIRSGGLWVEIPISWQDRVKGSSKFKVKHAIGFLRTLSRVK